MGILKYRRQYGESLIEILVSLVVISIGMLGIAALQIAQLRQITQANDNYIANLEAASIMGSMQANLVGVNKGYYNNISSANLSTYTQTDCSGSTSSSKACTPQQIAQNDAIQWLNNITAALPSGTGSITSVTGAANPTFTVQIQWQNGSATQTYSENITL